MYVVESYIRRSGVDDFEVLKVQVPTRSRGNIRVSGLVLVLMLICVLIGIGILLGCEIQSDESFLRMLSKVLLLEVLLANYSERLYGFVEFSDSSTPSLLEGYCSLHDRAIIVVEIYFC